MYNTNLFIQLAANAVQLIATCDKALSDANQPDKLFWLDSKTKAFSLFSDAMKSLGMTSRMDAKLIHMNHDDVARYLNHRMNCLMYSKTRRRHAVTN